MIRPQLSLDLSDELIVDNFAGGGGASTGIELALGRAPDLAINHDKHAVAMHQANHPTTVHECESVWDVDPAKVTAGRDVGLGWFSPDCKHFSKAKGGKPRDKKIRGLAWVVLRWIHALRKVGRRLRVIILENVEEFMGWCPVLPDGKPSAWRKGWLFKCFVGALRRRGYVVEWRELRACDFGTPTIRKRFFLIARCDGRRIVWPEATHAHPGSDAVAGGLLKPWRTAAECIDWSIACPSIFTRSRELAPATCRRIAKGVVRYVLEAAEPFILPLTHQGAARFYGMEDPLPTVTAAHRGELAMVSPIFTEIANATSPRSWSPEEPLRTICAEIKGGHHALVSAFLAKHYGGVVGAPMSGPVHTVTSTDHHSLVTAHITKFRSGSTGHGIDEPMHTVTANSFVKRPGGSAPLGLVTAHVAKLRGDNVGHGAAEPLHTVSAQGLHFAEVRAFLVKYYATAEDGAPLTEPMHTITSRDRFGLITVPIAGETYALADIGMRMLAPRELFNAQGFPAGYVIDWGYFEDKETGRLVRRPLTKTAQVRMCGNSVCPPLAAALVAANVPELAAWTGDERRARRAIAVA